ncbi:MAG TPA: hypothetical protein DIS79_04345 [Bacteroidetes bacterium]|nr:hypothetical protein [Bacteroidota bacterium]HRK05117.1 AAA family ATPase [Chlorobiota bacterium]
MTHTDKLIRLRIQNVRVFEDVTLDLDGLTILIGENGAGKSTIVDVLDLLGSMPSMTMLSAFPVFSTQPVFNSFIRQKAKSASLTIDICDKYSDSLLSYNIQFMIVNGKMEVRSETLDECINGSSKEMWRVFERQERVYWSQSFSGMTKKSKGDINGDTSLIMTGSQLVNNPHVKRLRTALSEVKVYRTFDVRPDWKVRKSGSNELSMRRLQYINHSRELDPSGDNLANVYTTRLFELTIQERSEIYSRMMLVLGEKFEELVVRPVDSGRQMIVARYSSPIGDIPLSELSDGQLMYLAHCAITYFSSQRTLVCFDEIECHTHPYMLVRMVEDYSRLSENTNVLLTTHSDVVLNSLGIDQYKLIVLQVDENGASKAYAIHDTADVREYVRTYGGVGSARQAGMLPFITRSI